MTLDAVLGEAGQNIQIPYQRQLYIQKVPLPFRTWNSEAVKKRPFEPPCRAIDRGRSPLWMKSQMQYLSTLSAARNPQKVCGLDKNVSDYWKLPGSDECFTNG